MIDLVQGPVDLVKIGPDADNPNNRRIHVNTAQWCKVYGWTPEQAQERAERIAEALRSLSTEQGKEVWVLPIQGDVDLCWRKGRFQSVKRYDPAIDAWLVFEGDKARAVIASLVGGYEDQGASVAGVPAAVCPGRPDGPISAGGEG